MGKSEKEVRSILINTLNKPFYGATVVLIPFFQYLRKLYPTARIIAYAYHQEPRMLLGLSLCDEVVMADRKKSAFTFIQYSYRHQIDMIINLRDRSEVLIGLLPFARARRKISLIKDPRLHRLPSVEGIKWRADKYIGNLYLDIARYLSGDATLDFSIFREFASREKHPIVCLIPAGGEGERKKWGIENFVALAKKILKKYPEYSIRFVYGKSEEEYSTYILNELPQERIELLVHAELKTLIKKISECRLSVMNDCGPSHIAHLLEMPSVSIWAWKGVNALAVMNQWCWPHRLASPVPAAIDGDIKEVDVDKIWALSDYYLTHQNIYR